MSNSTCEYYNINNAKNSCDYIRNNCNGVSVLFDYMSLYYCNLSNHHEIAMLILIIWLIILISILASTADYYFCPPLNRLSQALKLSPGIAGITLLAIGNGAPDLFSAISALNTQNDLSLLLSALLGASIFISTVVLASVLLTKPAKDNLNLKRSHFFRDIIVYMVVVATVIGVVQDGKITLAESLSFLILYICYILIVVIMSRFEQSNDNDSMYKAIDSIIEVDEDSKSNNNNSNDDHNDDEDMSLEGFTFPKKNNNIMSIKIIILRIQWLIELPFTILRWLSCPSCDGHWDINRRIIATISPMGFSMLLLLASYGWNGFTFNINSFPIYGLLLIISSILSIIIYMTTDNNNEPAYQSILAFFAFVSSIAWLNVIANEVVALLETLGIILHISSGILGLTVLAIGNSVGDLVADTTVAKNGAPQMGVASTLGSPLLNDVLGLGISLTVYCVKNGKSYYFDPHSKNFAEVKWSWVILGISLVSTLVMIPVQKFQPKTSIYSFYLYLIYLIFIIISVLHATNTINLFNSS